MARRSSALSPKGNKRNAPSFKKRRKSFTFRLFLFGIQSLIGGMICLLCLIAFYGYDLPLLHDESLSWRRPSITLVDKNHRLISTFGDMVGPPLSPSQIPLRVKQAFLAAEDRRFYHHWGVDFWGLARALWVNYQAHSVVQGGSTLTQQLAKNFLQTKKMYKPQDRSFRRKIQELMLAFWLESTFTKDQILALYLNRVYFGGGNFGLSSASHRYFHKPINSLSLPQSALLAGLVKAPSAYCPLSSPEKALQRARIVLQSMENAGFLSPYERRQAEEQLTPQIFSFMKGHKELLPSVGHFSQWILEELSNLVGSLEDDLVVITTLDWAAQREAYESFQKTMKALSAHKDPPQGAVLMMSPDGAVRAMIGGLDHTKSQFNRATQARRQPGSTFKLFVYLAAFEKGLTPDSFIEDTPLSGSWQPKNYGWVSRGHISLQEAFAHSVNTATVRVAQKIGLKSIQQMTRRLGVYHPLPNDLSLSLGSASLTLLEMTAAYGAVQKGGTPLWPYGIQKVLTRDKKKVLYEHHSSAQKPILDSTTLFFIKKLLYSVLDTGTGRAFSPPSSSWGGKTGSTPTDAWFIGYSPKEICGVWMGYDDQRPLGKLTGSQGPLQICQSLLKRHGAS